jgi:hypothetical protein
MLLRYYLINKNKKFKNTNIKYAVFLQSSLNSLNRIDQPVFYFSMNLVGDIMLMLREMRLFSLDSVAVASCSNSYKAPIPYTSSELSLILSESSA